MVIPNLILSRNWGTLNHLVYGWKPRIISPMGLNTLSFTAKFPDNYDRPTRMYMLFRCYLS